MSDGAKCAVSFAALSPDSVACVSVWEQETLNNGQIYNFSLTFELHQNLTRTWHRPGIRHTALCRLQYFPLVCCWILCGFIFQRFSTALIQHLVKRACDRNSFSFIIPWSVKLDVRVFAQGRGVACVFIVSIGQVERECLPSSFPPPQCGFSTLCPRPGQNRA